MNAEEVIKRKIYLKRQHIKIIQKGINNLNQELNRLKEIKMQSGIITAVELG